MLKTGDSLYDNPTEFAAVVAESLNKMLHDTRSDIYSRSDEFSDGETEYYEGECRGYEMILKSLKILGF